MHTYWDAFVYIKDQEIIRADLAITDVMPEIFKLMDTTVPDGLNVRACL